MDRSLGVLSFAVVLALIATPAVSADHHDLFRAGLRSFELGYWREALVFFEAAATEEPREGGRVREYGMWNAPYLPHFYQGAALYRLGSYAQALEALAESESQGVVRRRKNKKYYQRLSKLRSEIREAIEREVGRLHRGAAADYETLEALRKSPAAARQEGAPAVPEIGEIDRILENTTANLNDASLIAAASELQRAISLLDQAREGIETFARSVRERERELEARQQRVAAQARRNRARADILEARDLIAGGGCRRQAIELLENVERSFVAQASRPLPEEAGGGGTSDLDSLLARAHLQCDHLALAEEYLRRAGDRGRVPDSHLRTIARAIADRRRQQPDGADPSRVPGPLVEALSDYLLAAALAGEEHCQEPEISRLIERARKILGPGDQASASELPATLLPATLLPATLPFRYAPYLVLARAHRNCAARSDVETYLSLARELGRAPAAELAELETWLARNPKLEPYSGSYALLIGAYDYNLADGWPALYKPGEDVRKVRRALEAHGFQVVTLVNPTSEVLEGSLDDFFLQYGAERGHRLVFYYAGHGHTEQTVHGVKLGFIVPVDAGNPEQDRADLKRLFGMERFREYAVRSNANDMLFLFDSCFAGTVFRATRSCVPPDCVPPSAGDLSVRERVSRPVRMFLTAGKENQMVPDESVFRRMVTRALAGQADSNGDGFILGSELGSFVQNTTLYDRQTESPDRETSPLFARRGQEPAEPQWGTLSEGNFGLGDILFHTPEAETARLASPSVAERRGEVHTELAYWTAARRSAKQREVRRYLERFPEGRFAPLARWILERASVALDTLP